jgi:hypothetical protein
VLLPEGGLASRESELVDLRRSTSRPNMSRHGLAQHCVQSGVLEQAVDFYHLLDRGPCNTALKLGPVVEDAYLDINSMAS